MGHRSGIYIDDVDSAFRSTVAQILLQNGFIILVFIFVGLFISKNLTDPINRIVEAQNRIAKKDLTISL